VGESVQARAEDDVLADAYASASLFHNQILDEANTRPDGGAEEARGLWVHVRAAATAVVRSHQPQANLVFEQVRTWVELDVNGPVITEN
jgi:hypothetical protein